MRIVLSVFLVLGIINAAQSQSTWTTPVPIAHTNADDIHPAISNGQGWLFQGEEILAFSRNGKNICVLRTNGNGASWSDTVQYLTTDSADNDYPSLYHLGSGQNEIGMLVWQSRKDGNLEIYASKYGQFAWSTPERLTTSAEDDRFPHVTWVSTRYFAVWERRGRIVFAEYDGVGWSVPQYVTPAGDTLNSLPQVASVTISLIYEPIVIWEKRKGAETTSALMYSYRNGTVWTSPDTLLHSGDNHRPRFFKCGFSRGIVWEQNSGSLTTAYSGEGSMIGGRFLLQYVSPWTSAQDQQRNLAVNGLMIITGSPLYTWHSVSAWESRTLGIDSIGVTRAYPLGEVHKLSAVGATSNRNPDVSQGTRVGTTSFLMRFWVVWEANVLGRWQLYGSNTTILIDDAPEPNQNPNVFRLEQNYPNPFNPSTTIQFTVPYSGFVKLAVYDLLGKEVVSLVDTELPAGTHTFRWDASNKPSGVFFYRLENGSFVETKKLMLLH